LACVCFSVFGPRTHPVLLTVSFVIVTTGFGTGLLVPITRANRIRSRIRLEEAANLSQGISLPTKPWQSRPFEFHSRWTLLGLPLVHIRMEVVQGGKTLPAVGWFALGNIAYGVVFAFGGLAVGTISVGGCAVGLLAVGGGGLGLV